MLTLPHYFLFAGNDYYPMGGWDDFVTSTLAESDEEAISLLARQTNSDWAHIVCVHGDGQSVRRVWER